MPSRLCFQSQGDSPLAAAARKVRKLGQEDPGSANCSVLASRPGRWHLGPRAVWYSVRLNQRAGTSAVSIFFFRSIKKTTFGSF